jgi:hypothetical protein
MADDDLGTALAADIAPPKTRIVVRPRPPDDVLPGATPPAPVMPGLAEDLSRSTVLPPQPPADAPPQWDQLNQPVGELKPSPPPSPSERITYGLQDLLNAAGADTYTSNNLANKLMGLVQATPLSVPLAAADTAHYKSQGDIGGTVAAAAGMIPGVKPAAKVAKKVVQEAAPIGKRLAEAVPGIGHNMPPPDVTGKLNPLANERVTFGGKEPRDFTPEDWQAFGEHHGVSNLGPLSPPQTFKTTGGREFVLPGGTEGKWTYADLLHMKANPINPAEVDRSLHTQMQQKLGRTMTPENLSDADVWNGLVFGMTSPNNPLFPNQVAASRLRLRTPEMLDDLSSMIPWKPGETPTPQQRLQVSDNIAKRYGLASAEKGGLGVRGSADYSRVGEMAQLFKQNPEFFRKKPDEDWGQAVERISSQLPGLSMKTGSFGTVWQDPANAAISAIDRHMARELEKRGGLFENPEQRTAWQNRGVALWNKRSPDNPATSWSDLMSKSGSDGFIGEMLLDHVGNAAEPKFRLKGGEVNPKLPEHLANATWVREPETVFKMGQAYKRALAENQKLADKSGLSLFMSQWMEWDRIRNRFEPHENMFPGLSKTPAMSTEQLRGVDEAHRETGHKTYTKTAEGNLPPTRPLKGSASKMGYLGLGTAMTLPALKEKEKDTAD